MESLLREVVSSGCIRWAVAHLCVRRFLGPGVSFDGLMFLRSNC
jgi:hypothetical protein